MTRWLTHPWLTVRVEIALGALFVAAALPKVLDPPSFAHMVYNYRIVPGVFINAMALVLPWCELLAGIGLILGLFRGASSILITGFLLVFITAISWNYLRGNAIDCGCFDPRTAGYNREQKLALMRWDLWRDGGMLLMAVLSLAATARADRHAAPPLD